MINKDISEAEVFIDGASKGNPGPSGIGVVIIDTKKKKTYKISKCIGETTNNISEYLALIYALQELLPTKVKSLVVKSDSQLLVKQLNKEYKVKDKNIKLFFGLASNLIDSFKNFSLIQIDRSRNKEADRLASESINVLF